MASKTKPTEADATLALENPAALTGKIMPAEVFDGTFALPGPDAPEAAVEQGADGVTDTSGEDQAQPAEAAPADPAPADPAATEATAPVSVEQVDAMLQSLSDMDRETLLGKWGVLWIAGGLPDGPQADRDAALDGAAAIVDLARLLDEVGTRTAGNAVGPELRAFLAAEGAEISDVDLATVTLGGITASSQFGLHRALLDWCMIASRKIMMGAA